MKPERETNHTRLLILGNKLRVAGGEGRGMIGWLGDGHWEGMCCNEHWVLYKTDESQTCNPEINNILYIKKRKTIRLLSAYLKK